MLCEHYAKIHSDAHARGDPDNDKLISEQLDERLSSSADNSPLPPKSLTSPKEVALIIKRLKNRSAPGHDSIPTAVIKHLPKKAIVLMTKIFNSCLIHHHFPETWKIAHVIPILKPSKPLTAGQLQTYQSLANSRQNLRENNHCTLS